MPAFMPLTATARSEDDSSCPVRPAFDAGMVVHERREEPDSRVT
jgi:hypothetical protein